MEAGLCAAMSTCDELAKLLNLLQSELRRLTMTIPQPA